MIDITYAVHAANAAEPDRQRGMVMGEATRTPGAPEELKNDALSRVTLEQFLYECREQPAWRREADKCADYYDGNQLDAETIDKLKERGQPPLITNLIKPTIDTVLGMEARNRTDWRVKPEDDNIASDDTAEALSLKLKHAETESGADRACSDGYAAMLKAAVGWVEVGRESDPFKYKYRAKYIHRREIFWDWRSKEPDLTDARYLIRRRWLDVDHAIAMFPQYAELLRQTISGWAGFDPLIESDTGLARSFKEERDSRLEAQDWRDTDFNRVCLYEVWYRKWVRAYVMTLTNGRVVEVDFDNPMHVAAINSGRVKVKMATFQKVRLAWYCGPHFLYDIPSPYKHGYFPYAPFFGYREDLTNAPYSQVRSMMSPQDEVNARKSKMLWQLNSKTVITDADSVTDHYQTAKQVNRPDGYIKLNPNRKPTSRFEITPGTDLGLQQFQVMQEAKQEIAESSGIHKTLQGQQTGAKSGYAINSLVEQGTNTLGELNDNYQFARRMVGEILFSLVQEDLIGVTTPVTIGKGKSRRVIVLNEPAVDEQTGQPYLKNDVARVRAKVVLADVPSTPTFRMQQLQMLTEITSHLPQDIQALVMDFIIENTDLNENWRIADRIRKALNLPDDSPEGQKAAEMAAQQQQQVAQAAMQLEMREREADIAKVEAETAKIISEMQGAGQGDDSKVMQVRLQADQQIASLRAQIVVLQTRLANRMYETDKKTEADLAKARLSSATSIETAMIAHPQTDLAPVLAAIQKLQDQVSTLSSKETKG